MQHDFTLAPNGTQTIDVAGRFFKYKSGSGLIRVRATKGGYIDLLPGQGVENEEFTSLTVSDRTGLANAGTILAGNFNFRDETISGTVAVLSGEKSRVIAGNSFGGSVGCSPDPANTSIVQIYNPAGSGKNVFVNRIILGGSAAGEWYVTSTATQLATVVGTGFSNKKSGGAFSVAERRKEARASIGSTLFDVFVAINTPYDLVLAEPLMLPPGQGLCVFPGSVNLLAVANFQFYEDPI